MAKRKPSENPPSYDAVERLLSASGARLSYGQKSDRTERGLDSDVAEKKLSDVNNELTAVGMKLGSLNEKVKELSSHYSNLETEYKNSTEAAQKSALDLEKKIEGDKFKAVEIIGVFVALFTFVSSEIQIFKNAHTNREALGLSLVFAGLLTFFILILDVIVKSSDEWQKSKIRSLILLLVCVVLLAIGIMLVASENNFSFFKELIK